MAVVAVYKLNHELKTIFLENKNGMGSAVSYLIANTILVTPILFLFSFAALGIPGFVIQAYPASTFGPFLLLWTVQIVMWESSAEAFAAYFDDPVLGMLVHTGWWLAALLFSGILVIVEDVSFFVLWVHITSFVCANGLLFLRCSGRSKSSTMSSLTITISAVPCTSFSPKAHGNLVQIQRLMWFAWTALMVLTSWNP